MAHRTFHIGSSRSEIPLSLLLGGAFALALFAVMALVQMLGDVEIVENEIIEKVVAYTPPEVLDTEDEPPPPPDEEPPPELEVEPPQLSLAQLDLVLNPGTGGSIAGDFAMPTIDTNAASLGTADFVDFSDLDQTPRPLPGSSLDFPRRLKREAVSGRVVLLIKLDESGHVLEASVESSTLPDFDKIVSSAVSKWRFTPPTRQGEPVRAQARFPVPIKIGGQAG